MSESASRSVRVASRPALLAAAAVAFLLAATVALWAHYGTAVFYEMILSGLNACF
jgi:hypothetical protein